MAIDEPGPVVVKVGGSLFDLPDLGPRLRHWLTQQPGGRVLLIPGGGPAADLIRQFDELHRLGEEEAHWLAVSALTLTARFLAALLSSPLSPAIVVAQAQACAGERLQGRILVLDPYAFAYADEGQPGCLPHSWNVTSDSIAARVARVVGASELILLKSVSLPAGIDWTESGKRGLVDGYFAEAVGNSLPIRFVNFRVLPADLV
jgi:aspartokinase-like uncharacterized kinase